MYDAPARDPVATAEPSPKPGLDADKSRGDDNESSGSLAKDSYKAVVDKNKGKLKAIYDRSLETDPALGGKFVFEITIAKDGSVSQVTIASLPDGGQALATALAAEIHKWKFAPASDVTVITYPFVFVAKEQGK
jgi:membrane protein involved in colicin uptake